MKKVTQSHLPKAKIKKIDSKKLLKLAQEVRKSFEEEYRYMKEHNISDVHNRFALLEDERGIATS